MLSDILGTMKNLKRFWFAHEKFTNTDRMDQILENELRMKPFGKKDYTGLSRYKKEEKVKQAKQEAQTNFVHSTKVKFRKNLRAKKLQK